MKHTYRVVNELMHMNAVKLLRLFRALTRLYDQHCRNNVEVVPQCERGYKMLFSIASLFTLQILTT
jgi:hypothetical protein